MQAVRAPTIAQAWLSVLDRFREPTNVTRIPSRFGISFDIPGLAISVQNPSDLSLPAGFPYAHLVSDYVERLTGSDRDVSVIAERLFRWPDRRGTIDQLKQIEHALKEDPTTRAAVFGLWDAGQDSRGTESVSPVSGGFRMIDRSLSFFLVARSVDILVGLVPELVAFARIQHELAGHLGADTGELQYYAWSAHVYEYDYISYVAPR